jgi:hypothetical protein
MPAESLQSREKIPTSSFRAVTNSGPAPGIDFESRVTLNATVTGLLHINVLTKERLDLDSAALPMAASAANGLNGRAPSRDMVKVKKTLYSKYFVHTSQTGRKMLKMIENWYWCEYMFHELIAYIESDLEDSGFHFDGDHHDANDGCMKMFVHGNKKFRVGLRRGPAFSVIFNSEALPGEKYQIFSKEEWNHQLSPWAAQLPLVDFGDFGEWK